MAKFRYFIDSTRAAIKAHPGPHDIITGPGGAVIALCPHQEQIVCEGAFSYAPLVQRALEVITPRRGQARTGEVLKDQGDGSSTLEAYTVVKGSRVLVRDCDEREDADRIAAALNSWEAELVGFRLTGENAQLVVNALLSSKGDRPATSAETRLAHAISERVKRDEAAS